MSFLFGGGSNITNAADRINQFQSTVCDFGTALPIAYGTCALSPNLINYQDFTAQECRTTVETGKDSSSTTIDYKYYAYIELALCEGVIGGIANVWINNTKYTNIASFNAGEREGAPLAVNLGNDNNPTTYMVTHHPTIAVGYNNMAFLYGYVYLGTNSASIPSYKAEVQGALRNTGDGTDANPADVISDILTKVGLGSFIDTTSFSNYRTYCSNTDLLISTPSGAFTSQKKAQEVIKEILKLTNAYMFWSVDKFKIVPRDTMPRGSWTPPSTASYHLTKEDFLPQSNGAMVTFSVKDSSEKYNRFGVKFTNRANDYEQETVYYDNPASISADGLKAASTVDGTWLHTKARAIKVAEMMARINRTENVQYSFKLDWAFARLEPGDLVTLTDDVIGLNQQLCMIESVKENANGSIDVTALKRDGNVTEADYDVHTVDYNYVDWNIAPGNTAAPLFIIPPADLVTSANGLEIWIALHGAGANWGGCNVYVSDKDGSFSMNGTQSVSSVYGATTSALTANGTSVTVHFSNPKTVSILTGSQQDAERGNTAIWIDGEVMSYTLATLTAPNTYTLSGLIRGQYGTAAAAHAANSNIAVLDGGIYRLPLTKHYKNRTLYFKFPAFNTIKTNTQDINDLSYYTCNANTADLPNCTGVTAYNKYRELADDVVRYDIAVEWTPPTFSSYKQAQVWYKTSNAQASNIGTIATNTPASEIGWTSQWTFAGQGVDNVIIPQAVIGDTYKIAVCTEDIYGNVESPDSSSQVTLAVERKTEIPDTPNNVKILLSDVFTIKWDEVRNADIKYYEIRNDANVGVDSANLLGRTSDVQFSTNAITARTGTIYVFAVSAYAKASAPATLTYNFPAPSAPQVVAVAQFQGVGMSVELIPTNCNGVHFFVDGTTKDFDIKTNSTSYYYPCEADVYVVTAKYYDYFGDGVISNTATVTVTAKISSDLLDAEAVTVESLSQQVKDSITQSGVDTANVAVKGLLDSGSALVMTGGSLALVASNGQTLTGLFANESGVMRLQGDYIHITGNAVIDNDLITGGMIQAGAIDAGKLSTSLITLTDNQGLNGGAVTLNANGLNCALTNGSKVQFNSNGMSFVDSNNNVFSSLARFKAGTVSNGEYVTLNWDVVPHTVLLFPHTVQTMVQGYTATNLYIKCYPEGITANGFTAKVYTVIGSGTSTTMSYNGINARNINASDGSGAGWQTDYSDYISATNPVAGSVNTTFSFSAVLDAVCHGTGRGTYYSDTGHEIKVYLETYVGGVLQTTDYMLSERLDYTRDFSRTLNVYKVIPLSANQTVQFRFKLEHLDWVCDWWAPGTYAFTVDAGSVPVEVTGETMLSSGTAHYLALG